MLNWMSVEEVGRKQNKAGRGWCLIIPFLKVVWVEEETRMEDVSLNPNSSHSVPFEKWHVSEDIEHRLQHAARGLQTIPYFSV